MEPSQVVKKYNKYKISETQKSMRKICFPHGYQLQIQQKFLEKFYKNEDMKGILIYHEIGAGKTCVMIRMAESLKKERKILVVVPASLRDNFKTELRSPCAGNSYLTDIERQKLKTLTPSSIEYRNIIKISDERINKYYQIISYNQFIDYYHHGKLKLNNTFLIIDEIHNMISTGGTFCNTLEEAIEKAPKTLKLAFGTATPIFDRPIESAILLNMIPGGKKIPINGFEKKFMNIKETSHGFVYTPKNIDIYRDALIGKVSYYRGAPAIAYPKQNLKLVKIKMSPFQLKMYKFFLGNTKLHPIDHVNEVVSNSFYLSSRLASNFVFPNGHIGQKGVDSLQDKHLSQLDKYSPKMNRIYNKIKKCQGPVFVYSSFKEYCGILTMVRILEYHGYLNVMTHGSGKKRYAIWSGDENDETKGRIKTIFNKAENKDGSQLKVMLGSPSIKEGVSLLRVKEVHVLEPYWNMSRMDQVIGRAIRYCSHKDLPPEEREVDVYIYLATHPDVKESIDQRIMFMAYQKQKITKEFKLAMKEAAIDCHLFSKGNVYPGEDKIVCYK
jgi:superfamily II DNA or RNA helicase